ADYREEESISQSCHDSQQHQRSHILRQQHVQVSGNFLRHIAASSCGQNTQHGNAHLVPIFQEEETEDRNQDDKDKASGARDDPQGGIRKQRQDISRMIGQLLLYSRNDRDLHRWSRGWNGGRDRRLEFREELWEPGGQCVRLLDYTRAKRNSYDNQKPDYREVDERERRHL